MDPKLISKWSLNFLRIFWNFEGLVWLDTNKDKIKPKGKSLGRVWQISPKDPNKALIFFKENKSGLGLA
jgi:hypothetical protein